MKKIFITVFIFTFYFTTIATAKQNKAFTKVGDWGQVILPIAAAGISYLKEDNFNGTKQLAKTYASTMLVTYGLKYTIHAERPNGKKDSFPSGHASSAFGGASFLAFRYGYKYGIPAYLGAIAVGASRINANQHSLADVVASATISLICGNIFTTRFKETVTLGAGPVKGGGQVLTMKVAL